MIVSVFIEDKGIAEKMLNRLGPWVIKTEAQPQAHPATINTHLACPDSQAPPYKTYALSPAPS